MRRDRTAEDGCDFWYFCVMKQMFTTCGAWLTGFVPNAIYVIPVNASHVHSQGLWFEQMCRPPRLQTISVCVRTRIQRKLFTLQTRFFSSMSWTTHKHGLIQTVTDNQVSSHIIIRRTSGWGWWVGGVSGREIAEETRFGFILCNPRRQKICSIEFMQNRTGTVSATQC